MTLETVPTGLAPVGEQPWGTHFCHLYRTAGDLADCLVPFFKAGLDRGEACIWLTCDPFGSEDARTALRQAVPDLADREALGQIHIAHVGTFYGPPDEVLERWLAAEAKAVSGGRPGLRLTGNAYWLEREHFASFADYEAQVNEAFRGKRVLALCSYCLSRCEPEDMLDVVKNHEFAVVRRDGAWEMMESTAQALAKRELQALAAALEDRVRARTSELERALAVREEFLSVASHELRTPITSLQLSLQRLARGDRDAGVLVDRALRQARRLDRLIGQLLEVSQHGRPGLCRERLDLAELATESCELLAETLARSGCRLEVQAAPAPAWGDASRLRQVLENLLTNAAKYAPAAPVHVRTGAVEGSVFVEVEDHGPGIPAEAQPRLFRRFERLDAGGSGLGLGLWISREIAESHGGTLTVESEPGRGARFRLDLPRDGRVA